jgi:hypothetical protein
LFDIGDDLWMNPFKKKRDDTIKTTPKDPLQVSIGQIKRSRAKYLNMHSMDLFKISESRWISRTQHQQVNIGP